MVEFNDGEDVVLLNGSRLSEDGVENDDIACAKAIDSEKEMQST